MGVGAVTARSTAKTQVWMRSGATRNSARRTARYITAAYIAGWSAMPRLLTADFLRRNNTRRLPSV